MQHRNIILIGFMGSGKTTLGKKIAQKIGFEFVDTDLLIEQQNNLSTSEIFVQKGQDYFRLAERDLLNDLKQKEHQVIAVGGGLPCFFDNMQQLKQMGTVVYLQRPVKELHQRVLPKLSTRPLLANKSSDELLEYMTELLEKRESVYLEAHIIANRNEQTVTDLLLKLDFSIE